MKGFIIILVANIMAINFAFSQGAAINSTGASPDPSATLDVSGTTQGVLINRMTTAQRNVISLPAKGLQIYNTDCDNFNYNAGTPNAPNWLQINPSPNLPAAAGTISGSATACQGQTGVSYSVSPIANATSYTWAFSGTGATINGSTNSITINFSASATSGSLTVMGTNACGTGIDSAPLAITINAAPSAPTATAASSIAQTSFSANWNSVSGATTYYLDVSTVNTFASFVTGYNNLNVGNVVTTSVTGLTCNTTYYYRVRGGNTCGAINNSNVVSTTTSACVFVCGTNQVVTHTANVNGAPVSKTVTYGTVSYSSLCWITQDLGADHAATSSGDATEASSGWYWQFNRSQGYKLDDDGVTRTPNSAWISSISENSNWTSANDPCTLLLGSTWRLPTSSELTTASNGWTTATAYSSAIKIHNAGYLFRSSGALTARGTAGAFFSSTQNGTADFANTLFDGDNGNGVAIGYKSHGQPVRCVR